MQNVPYLTKGDFGFWFLFSPFLSLFCSFYYYYFVEGIVQQSGACVWMRIHACSRAHIIYGIHIWQSKQGCVNTDHCCMRRESHEEKGEWMCGKLVQVVISLKTKKRKQKEEEYSILIRFLIFPFFSGLTKQMKNK